MSWQMSCLHKGLRKNTQNAIYALEVVAIRFSTITEFSTDNGYN